MPPSRRSMIITVAVLATIAVAADAARAAIDTHRAAAYFQEARDLVERDGGALWGLSPTPRIIFVDPATRQVVASHSDSQGRLTPQGDVFVGKLPKEQTVANTATEWAGVKWTMLLWPLPTDAADRRCLLAHELWHSVQDTLGLPASNPDNDHLDTRDGRIWLQLEWRALTKALATSGSDRQQAIADALLFRAFRRSLSPGAAETERALEMNEGLAEYTGIRMSCETDKTAARRAAGNLKDGARKPTFVRSFAYASGPAYGLLLDAYRPDWRDGLRPTDDLGQMLGQAVDVALPSDPADAARKRADVYDGAALINEETKREKKRQARIALHRKRFVEDPVLVLPLGEISIEFNPNNLEPLGELGTVYPTMKLTDRWGTLTVTGGALRSADWHKVIVPAPADPDARPIKGEGYALDLSEGWSIRQGQRAGDYTLGRVD